jgi:hypothetical protein
MNETLLISLLKVEERAHTVGRKNNILFIVN